MSVQSQKLTVSTIKGWVSSLAQSQGFYGRVKRELDESSNWGAFAKELRNNNVKTQLDMVMFLKKICKDFKNIEFEVQSLFADISNLLYDKYILFLFPL